MDISGLVVAAMIAGAGVFFVSLLIWMVSGIHDKDIKALPDEGAFMADLAKRDIPAGFYMWPNCHDRKDMGSDDFKKRWKAGPWGTLNVSGYSPNFARNLIGSMVLNILIALGIAVAISMVLSGPSGEAVAVACNQCQVFWPAVILGCCVYCLSPICDALYMGKQTRFILTSFGDGLAYALVTALLLTAMWPG